MKKRVVSGAGSCLALSFCCLLLPGCGGGGGGGNGDEDCEVMPASIEVDTTLPAGCYLAEQDVYVSEAAVLTLEPGVEIIFSQDKTLYVSDEAALSAAGTADDPILFTGAQESRGFWGGIVFTNANSVDNRFEHVTVEYAGAHEVESGLTAAVALDSSGYPVQLAMSRTTLRENEGYGLYLSDEAALPGFSDNIITANTEGAVYLYAEVGGQLDDTTSYTGNDRDLVYVECAYGLEADQTWPAIDVDYHLHASLIVSGHMTIAAGARLVFMEDAGLEIGDSGMLTAAGTGSAPILFTGLVQERGSWRGVIFTNSDHVENRLDHLTIEYGGGWEFTSGLKAGLALDSSGYPVKVRVTNTTIRESEGYGLFLRNEAELPDFADNTITANTEGAAYVLADAAGQLDDTTGYTGNDRDIVYVECAYGLNYDQTWPAIDVDYLMHESLYVTSHLTIAPGARLVFMQDAGMEVYDAGMLTAAGTAEDPIVFTGAEQIAGYWGGVIFTNSNHLENQLTHVTVEYGGGYDFGDGYANIALDSSGYTVSLEMTDCNIRHSGGWGLWLAQESSVNGDIETANQYDDNASGDVFRE